METGRQYVSCISDGGDVAGRCGDSAGGKTAVKV